MNRRVARLPVRRTLAHRSGRRLPDQDCRRRRCTPRVQAVRTLVAPVAGVVVVRRRRTHRVLPRAWSPVVRHRTLRRFPYRVIGVHPRLLTVGRAMTRVRSEGNPPYRSPTVRRLRLIPLLLRTTIGHRRQRPSTLLHQRIRQRSMIPRVRTPAKRTTTNHRLRARFPPIRRVARTTIRPRTGGRRHHHIEVQIRTTTRTLLVGLRHHHHHCHHLVVAATRIPTGTPTLPPVRCSFLRPHPRHQRHHPRIRTSARPMHNRLPFSERRLRNRRKQRLRAYLRLRYPVRSPL